MTDVLQLKGASSTVKAASSLTVCQKPSLPHFRPDRSGTWCTIAMNSERKASNSVLSETVGSCLDLGHAAIDVKLDSGHVTRFVRCKEGNSFGDLIRIPQPA